MTGKNTMEDWIMRASDEISEYFDSTSNHSSAVADIIKSNYEESVHLICPTCSGKGFVDGLGLSGCESFPCQDCAKGAEEYTILHFTDTLAESIDPYFVRRIKSSEEENEGSRTE